ncbi:MAG: hypothetical protein NVS3B25_35070 [Hymenobacter sp.]
MKPSELSHHVETVLEIAEGIIDLHTRASDFHETWWRYLLQLQTRVDEELTRVDALLEQARLDEARDEPEYRY